MARTKQSTIIRHEVEDGWTHRENGSSTARLIHSNGTAQTPESDFLKRSLAEIPVSLPPQQAGLAELVICVGGIYVSLYAYLIYLLDSLFSHLTPPVAFPGPSFKNA